MWQAILAFFKAWSSTNEVIVKTLPSEKVADEKFELSKEKLSVKERRKIYDSIAMHLQMHPKEDIDLYVEVVCDSLSIEDIAEIKQALHKRFENRLHSKFKINK